MKRKREKENKSIRNAVIFCSFIAILILLSLVAKIIFLISDSLYDGHHRFTIAIIQEPLLVLSFSEQAESISILVVSQKDKQVTSKEKLSQLLRIPIDGYLADSIKSKKALIDVGNVKDLSDNKVFASRMKEMLLAYPRLKADVTIIDMIRFFLVSARVPSHKIKVAEITTKASDAMIDEISSTLFQDATLAGENVSISIVNGTKIQGLGGRLERLLLNSGANVVAVSSSPSDIVRSEIVSVREDLYTVKKIASITGFPVVVSKSVDISDVIIRIGEDRTHEF